MPRPEEEFGKAVGRRIRRLRKARGMTQTQLCELTGLDAGGISRYENDTRRIPS
jgi:transcriptional regulator with XRE-family HTH domain